MSGDPATRALAVIGLCLGAVGVLWLGVALSCVVQGADVPTLSATADAAPRLLLHPSVGPAAWAPPLEVSLLTFWFGPAMVLLGGSTGLVLWLRNRVNSPLATRAPGFSRRLPELSVPSTPSARLVLGRLGRHLVAAERDASLAVIGPTGCGKTAGLAIPALLEWQGPILAASVKSDLLATTGDHRRRRGAVQTYDPGGTSTCGWDPVTHASTWAEAQRMAAWVCDAGRPTGSSLSESDYWITQAAKALAPHLYTAARAGLGIHDVVAWIDTQEEHQLERVLQQEPHPDASTAQQHLRALWMKDERLRSSVYATVEAVLLPYADPGVQDAVHLPPLDFNGWLDGDNTIYLVAPSHEQARLRPIFTVVAQTALRAAYASANAHGGRLVHRCLVLLDEAGNIAPLPDLATYATTARSHGISLVTVWQDIAQLRARYGTSAQTVLSNHRARVFGAGIADQDTLRYLSALLGEHRRKEHQHSTDLSSGRRTRNEHTSWRPAAPVDALRRIPNDTAILLYGNRPAAHLKLRPWYRDRRLRERGAA